MAQRVGLALAGGGARGIAHIGVLKALEERGYEPSAIAGTSMGAILGAFIAAGWSSERILHLVETIKWHDLMEAGEHGALLGNGKIGDLLREHLPSRFEDLEIPLHVMAVDCQEGRLVDFNRGKLVPALLASSAIPGILSPIHYQDRWLLDGGMLNNLPVDIIRTLTHDPIVAVEVGAPANRKLDFEKPESLWERWTTSLPSIKFDKSVGFYADHRGLTIELFLKSFDIPIGLATRIRLAVHPPELLIVPPLAEGFGIEDFQRAEEALDAGYREAVRKLDGIQLERE